MPGARENRGESASFEELLGALRSKYHRRFLPSLRTYAHKFTIYLPLLSGTGKEVFSIRQVALLEDLFREYFGGFSSTAREGKPPWFGSWSPRKSGQPIKDQHTLIVVYSRQVDEALAFFRQVKWILQQPQVAKQKVVVIEYTSVQLLEEEKMAL